MYEAPTRNIANICRPRLRNAFQLALTTSVHTLMPSNFSQNIPPMQSNSRLKMKDSKNKTNEVSKSTIYFDAK